MAIRWFILALAGLACGVSAQSWPGKPVRIVIGFAPGGTTDLIGRPLAERLSRVYGQQFIVENRPGASGQIAVDHVVAQSADPHALLLTPADPWTIVPHLAGRMRFDPNRDFTYLTAVARGPIFIVAHPSVAANNVAELKALASTGTALGYATSGVGTGQHLAGELFRERSGVKMVHIPYKGGGQAISDLIGGQVPLGVLGSGPLIPQIRAGKVKALAVTTRARLPTTPEVPTLDEQGLSGFDVSQWFMLVGPAGLPVPAAERLVREVGAIVNDAEFKARLLEVGLVPATGTPAELRAEIDREKELWGRVIRDNAIKGE